MSSKTIIEQPLRPITEEEPNTSFEAPLAPAGQGEGNSQVYRPDWSKIQELGKDSLEARWLLEKYPVMRELWRSHVRMTTYYMSPSGGNLSMDEAIKRASAELGEGAAEEEIKFLASQSVDAIDWYSIDRIFRSDPAYAQLVWEDIKGQALADFKSGHYAAELFERTDFQKNPWQRAHFVVIYQEMVDDWKPRGTIELTMIEVLAVNYFLWRYWVMEHLQRATSEPRRESHDYEEWRRNRKACYSVNGQYETREFSGQYLDGAWDVRFQSEADAVQQAAELADRFRRAYQSQLRTLRDWRRYGVPVIVQNAGQVNIAGEGANQTNIQKKSKRSEKVDKQQRPARPEIRLASSK